MTAGDAAVDVAPSLAISGRADDPIAEIPAIVDGGVPTAKAFMVYDFRLDDRRLFEALGAMGRAGGVLSGPLRGSGADRCRRVARRLPGGHATARPCRLPDP